MGRSDCKRRYVEKNWKIERGRNYNKGKETTISKTYNARWKVLVIHENISVRGSTCSDVAPESSLEQLLPKLK